MPKLIVTAPLMITRRMGEIYNQMFFLFYDMFLGTMSPPELLDQFSHNTSNEALYKP
jgi:hypothetical protein